MKIQYIAERKYPDSNKYPDGKNIQNYTIQVTTTQNNDINLLIEGSLQIIMTKKEADLLAMSLHHGSNTVIIN